jgi:hypothetical protein
MRMPMIATLTLLLFQTALGQEPAPTDPHSQTEISNPISLRAVKNLPPRDKPPKISLRRALRIADRFIKAEQIDILSSYLWEARWGLVETDSEAEEPRWHFRWVRLRGGKEPKADVRVAVSADGKARLLAAL